MTDSDRLNKIAEKLDHLIGLMEGQNLDERVSRIESKFWPIVGVVAVATPVLTGLTVAYLR